MAEKCLILAGRAFKFPQFVENGQILWAKDGSIFLF